MTAARIKEIRDRWAKATKGQMVQWAGGEGWQEVRSTPQDQAFAACAYMDIQQ